MTADKENISHNSAMKRGQAFGWGKIIEAGNSMKKDGHSIGNTDVLENVGQGIHALQDAIAHKGINMKEHNSVTAFYNDIFPSSGDGMLAPSVAKTGIIVAEVLGGIKEHVIDGMIVDLTGATQEQFNTIKSAFQSIVNESAGKIKSIIFKGNPDDKKQ